MDPGALAALGDLDPGDVPAVGKDDSRDRVERARPVHAFAHERDAARRGGAGSLSLRQST
jgi:hypothetical protein